MVVVIYITKAINTKPLHGIAVCLKKTLNASGHLMSIPQSGLEMSKRCCCCCCCFSHSAHWLPTRKKLLYTLANPARGLLNREKKKKKKSGSAPPPPPRARCSFGEKIKIRKLKIKKSRGASTCLGATQAGVTQVVSVRLASVQGFLRLVS